jgi:regulator of nonsense transcripts 1
MSNKRLAFFNFASDGDAVRLVPGDELKVKYISDGVTSWKSRGTIVKITANEEICLELKSSSNPPNESKFTIEFVWKSTSFDRMKLALKIFLKDETSVSEYIFYKILGNNTSE